MNEKTEENLNDIAAIVAKMKEYDGQKIGHNVDTFMIHCREKIIDLSGGEVNVDFNSLFTNIVSGTYHTYLICDSEIKEAIAEAIENLPEEEQEEEQNDIIYSFTSYSDENKTTKWGQGTVKLTGNTDNGYSEVEVVTNSPESSFVGKKFYIISNAKTDGTAYPLYTDAGNTAAGIYVTISL